jgi:hypothetical protein
MVADWGCPGRRVGLQSPGDALRSGGTPGLRAHVTRASSAELSKIVVWVPALAWCNSMK